MNPLILPGDCPALDPLYLLLPFVLAGFVTAVLFSVHGIRQLFARHHQGSK